MPLTDAPPIHTKKNYFQYTIHAKIESTKDFPHKAPNYTHRETAVSRSSSKVKGHRTHTRTRTLTHTLKF